MTKRWQIDPYLLWGTNRNPPPTNLMPPLLLTSDDLEGSWPRSLIETMWIVGKRWQIDPYLPCRTNRNPPPTSPKPPLLLTSDDLEGSWSRSLIKTMWIVGQRWQIDPYYGGLIGTHPQLVQSRLYFGPPMTFKGQRWCTTLTTKFNTL